MVFTVTGKEPVAHRGREGESCRSRRLTDKKSLPRRRRRRLFTYRIIHSLYHMHGLKGGMETLHFKNSFWKDGMENDQEKRKTLTEESVVPCVHKRVKKLGLQGQRGTER